MIDSFQQRKNSNANVLSNSDSVGHVNFYITSWSYLPCRERPIQLTVIVDLTSHPIHCNSDHSLECNQFDPAFSKKMFGTKLKSPR